MQIELSQQDSRKFQYVFEIPIPNIKSFDNGSFGTFRNLLSLQNWVLLRAWIRLTDLEEYHSCSWLFLFIYYYYDYADCFCWSICFHYFYISKHHYFWPLLTIVISARSERTYIYHQWFLIIYHQLNFYSYCDPHLWYHPQYLWPPSYHLKHIYDPYEKNTNIIPSYAGSRPPKAPRFRRHGAGHRALPAPRLAGAQRQAPQPAAAHHLGGTNATQVGPGVE
jgi:hypothetical protein